MSQLLQAWQMAMITASLLLTVSCGEDLRSPDYDRADQLLPRRGEYTDSDLHTRPLAEEMAGMFDSRLSMIYYDAQRTTPQLYFTAGQQDVLLSVNRNGSIHLHIDRFHTQFMPLHLTVDIDVLLEATATDTIRLSGHDGEVRTDDGGKTIGLPLPESDDAQLTGFYLRSSRQLHALVDLMLPIPMKMRCEGSRP